MSTQKRERSVNFSREEVDLLTSLVADHKNILENKKSDSATWQEKEQCWKTLELLFNRTSGVNFRSAKTLKSKYEGLKRATRKKSALIVAESYCTGGGPSAATPLTPIEKKVKDMIFLSVEGIESQFDSDRIDRESIHSVEADVAQKEDSDEEQPPNRKISECDSATPKKLAIEKWTNWKPKYLRSKKHPALSAVKMKRPFEKVSDSKLEIADLQKKILDEELLNKRKQWAFEEEEREHKRELWAIEKSILLNKLEK
ncbi:uncharacterized protein LOC110995892 [Pieris rapae]|uniref:uncharacterized protein LOC110995892 n=1 Tax=Pieris rapae TaxID=64459 RepID=UPI001E27A4DC|nr:uncharacterized protein LOC110995892 [Pieris rapae]